MSTKHGVRGRFVTLELPKTSDFVTEDIAHTLARKKRFGDSYDLDHSVAQHSVLVASVLSAWGEPNHVIFAGLHHDDSEAILGDLPSPVKKLSPDFLRLENAWNEVLNMRYMIDISHPRVKEADQCVLANEVHVLLPARVRAEYGVAYPKTEISLNLMEPWTENKAYFMYMEYHIKLERAIERALKPVGGVNKNAS